MFKSFCEKIGSLARAGCVRGCGAPPDLVNVGRVVPADPVVPEAVVPVAVAVCFGFARGRILP